MDAGPAHQPEAHGESADRSDDQRKSHERDSTGRQDRPDRAGNQKQRKKRIDRPDSSHGRATGAKSRQNLGGRTIENVGIVEVRSQVAEDEHERQRTEKKLAPPTMIILRCSI